MKRLLILLSLAVTTAYAEFAIEMVAETESGEEYLVNSNTIVPKDTGNRHYRAIQEWIAQGNRPSPYVAPTLPKPQPTPEEEIATLKARIAELETKEAAVEVRVKALEDKAEARE